MRDKEYMKKLLADNPELRWTPEEKANTRMELDDHRGGKYYNRVSNVSTPEIKYKYIKRFERNSL